MSFTVRFGNGEDFSVLSREDNSIPSHQMKWKLSHNEFIVAQDGKNVVGYLRLEYLWSKYPYIGLIIVSPAYRNQGIGKAILNFLEHFLREQDHRVLYSSSQADEAEPQRWHRNMGFKECGIINGINPGSIGEVFFSKEL